LILFSKYRDPHEYDDHGEDTLTLTL